MSYDIKPGQVLVTLETLNGEIAKLRADVVAALRAAEKKSYRSGNPWSAVGVAADWLSSPPPPKVELPAIDWNCVAGHRILTNCDHHGDLIEIAKLIRDGNAEIVLKEGK